MSESSVRLKHKLEKFSGLIIGLITFIIVVGIERLDPRNIGWIFQTVNPDTEAQYLGWEIYRRSEWGFPLGSNLGLLEMESSIIFSGGIPLFEIPLKILNPILGFPFQYLGIWLLFCFLMQGYAAWNLLEKIDLKNIALKVLATALFTFSPIMLWRVNLHLGLVAHFLIIIGITLLLNEHNSCNNAKWTGLIAVSLMIHAYFSAMIIIMYSARMIRLGFEENTKLSSLLKQMSITTTIIYIVAFVLGYFDSGSGISSGWPNHLFKMDALQPFNFSGYSFLFSKWAPTPIGNPEGFNYLGIGVILSIIFIVIRRRDFRLCKSKHKDRPLFLILAFLFTLYSLSNRISIGRYFLEIPLPNSLSQYMEIFRASGRFFWPVYYGIYLILFVCIRELTKPKAIMVFGLLFTLQIADSSYFWSKISEINRNKSESFNFQLPLTEWQRLSSNYREIAFQQDLRSLPRYPECPFWQEIGRVAGQFGFNTNCIYLARYNPDRLMAFNNELDWELKSGMFKSDRIYILRDGYQRNFDSSSCAKVIKSGNLNILLPNYYCTDEPLRTGR